MMDTLTRGCMRRSLSDVLALLTITTSFFFLPACGGHKPPGASPFPGKISITPSVSASVQAGSIIAFSASAQNNVGGTVSPTFTFTSSNASILSMSSNGIGCAGHWDANFTTCTPSSIGTAEVTASALGATSPPTLVFVHQPIDNIQISQVTTVNQPPPACAGQQTIPASCATMKYAPTNGCLSANQTMTLQATAFSQGVDITAQVGPFTWSQAASSVANLTPITTSSTNLPTNQITVTPSSPGFTPVYATASGASSQPYYTETCPVQCIALELGTVGSNGSGQTNFLTNTGTNETVTATAVDVQGCVVPTPALTWSSSQPASVLAGSGSTGCGSGTTCGVTTPQPGAGTITASCTPPGCNAGFPQSVAGLNLNNPPFFSPLIQPAPVYPVLPISGLVNGVPVATSVLAGSVGCAADDLCSVNFYNVSTSTNLAGNALTVPAAPNSVLFDLAGDKAYMGSAFGAEIITPANIGGSTSPISSLGTVTGNILAVSRNGNFAVFSDTLRTPNQVYIVNAINTAAPAAATLNISGATAAAFSPDGLKTFILGGANQSTLYIYSGLQALQTIPLAAPADAVAFSANGAFAFVNVSGGSSSSIAAYNTCNSGLALTLPLPTAVTPSMFKVLPDGVHLLVLDTTAGGTGFDYITTSVAAAASPALCPQTITATSQHFSFGQGTFTPINFFLSPDSSQIYLVTKDRGILFYNFNTGSTAGISLANNAAPLSADMTVDGTLLYVAGSDGTLHEINLLSLTDMQQIQFPTQLGTFANGFCSEDPQGSPPCVLNLVAVKP